jgi:murein DD-endopeptidase MepM/ murein hydrolase activator NlpD
MRKNCISLIIIPHLKGKQRTFSLSTKKVKVISGLTALFVLILVGILVHYAFMTGLNHKYKLLLDEQTKQQEKFDQYEQTISRLQDTIISFEEYAKKLNIMAGLKSSEVLNMEAGMGAGATRGQFSSPPILPQNHKLDQLSDISQQADLVEQNLNTLVNFFGDKALQMAYTPSIKPTNGYISSPYTMRNDPFTGKWTMHWGIDIVTAEGNPVVATADGLVIRTGKDKISGNYVKISHKITGYVTVYCHLSKILVRSGTKVKRGETIGLVGKTGKALGAHVHYEVHKDGQAVNPWYYLLEE